MVLTIISIGWIMGIDTIADIINKISWDILIKDIAPTIFKYHNDIKKMERAGKVDAEYIKDFDLSFIWKGTGRLDWINRIRNNPEIESCIESCESRLNNKYDEKWLRKYHKLYYNIKNNGFRETDSPMMAIRFNESTYYRMDGTHRSSVLHDLGIKKINILIFDFDAISEKYEEIKLVYETWILSNYQNYQKFNTEGESRIKERYLNLIEKTSKYWEGKDVGDIGCNAGYLSIFLAKDKTKSVKGFDISELDIAAAKIHSSRILNNTSKVKFHLGHVIKNLNAMLKCEVLFFVRSIYHLGNDANLIMKTIKKGTIVIIECNKGHKKSLPKPDTIDARAGKRLALKLNLVPYLENHGFEIIESIKNVDDVIIAKKT